MSCLTALAIAWIPAQLCNALPVHACETDTIAALIQTVKKQTDISQALTLTDTGHGIFLCDPNGIREGWGIDTHTGELYYTHRDHRPASQRIKNRMVPILPQTAE